MWTCCRESRRRHNTPQATMGSVSTIQVRTGRHDTVRLEALRQAASVGVTAIECGNYRAFDTVHEHGTRN